MILGIKFTMKELEKLEEDAEAALDDFFKEVHPDVEEAMNVAGITEEDLDEAEEEAEEALEEAEDEVEKLDISEDDVEHAAEAADVVSAKHHHGHLHKGNSIKNLLLYAVSLQMGCMLMQPVLHQFEHLFFIEESIKSPYSMISNAAAFNDFRD